MEAYGSVSMVKGLAFAVLVAVSLAGCNPSSEVQEAANADSVVTPQEAARVELVPFQSARVDSFRLRLAPGQTFRYRVRQFAESGSDSAVATTTSTHVYTKTVRSVRSDGSYEIAMRFDSVKVDYSVKNRITGAVLGEQRFNSADTAQRNRPEMVQFSALIGENVSIFVSPTGSILEVGDVTPIVKKMVAATKQEVPPAYMAQFGEQIKQAIYASFYGQENVPFPKAGIDSSGRWTNTSTSNLGELFTVATTATYTIAGFRTVQSRKIAEINAVLNGQFTVKPMPKSAKFAVKLTSSKISGKSHSLLDATNGITVSKSNEILLNVEADLTIEKQGTRRITQSQINRYEIELLP